MTVWQEAVAVPVWARPHHHHNHYSQVPALLTDTQTLETLVLERINYLITRYNAAFVLSVSRILE